MKPREGVLSPRATSLHARRTCSTLRNSPCLRTHATHSSTHSCPFMRARQRLLPRPSARAALDPSLCIISTTVSVCTACLQAPLGHIRRAATFSGTHEILGHDLDGDERLAGALPGLPRLIVLGARIITSDRDIGPPALSGAIGERTQEASERGVLRPAATPGDGEASPARPMRRAVWHFAFGGRQAARTRRMCMDAIYVCVRPTVPVQLCKSCHMSTGPG